MSESGDLENPHQADMTRGVRALLGDPKKAVLKLSTPMIVAMLVQSLYNIADGIWVSGLGADALAAIGLFFPVFMFIISIAVGISIGGSATISRKIGARNKELADSAANHTLIIGIGLGIILTLILFLFIDSLFSLIGTKGRPVFLAMGYARILIAGTVILLFSNVASGILRGEGDTKRAMYAMVFGSLLNIVLDPIFIYRFRLGVVGAAWATLTSISASAVVFIFWLFIKRDTYVTINLKGFRFNGRIIFEILRVGIPSSFAQFSMALAMFILNVIVVKVAGTNGIAVFTSAWRIIMLGIVPLLGIAIGVTAVTAAAYGAQDFDKLDRGYLYGIKFGFLIELGIVSAVLIFAPQIAHLFTYSRGAVHIFKELVTALRWLVIFLLVTPFGLLTSSMFQGIGRGENSLAVTILRTLIMQVFFSYLLGYYFNFGLRGVWWGIVIGNILASIISFTWGRFTIQRLRLQTAGV